MTVATLRTESWVRRFAASNVRLSHSIEARLGIEDDKPFWRTFEDMVTTSIASLPSNATIVDLGGGRRCTFASQVPRDRGVRIVAVDISPEELAANHDVDETRVADVTTTVPFRDAEVDLLISKTLLEHVDGVPAAAANIAKAMKPGGTTLHFIPGRYSLFGVAARTLPFQPLLRLLHLTVPESIGHVEFDVFYDHCYPSAIERVFHDAGFARVKVHTCYAQNGYFTAVFPLFCFVAAYQAIVRRLHLTRMAAYMIVEAQR